MNVANNALIATWRLTGGGSSAVRPMKTGVFAIGFMIAKKPMNTDRVWPINSLIEVQLSPEQAPCTGR